jgi:oxygen-independent coproporphyrinogen-3 oxidase
MIATVQFAPRRRIAIVQAVKLDLAPASASDPPSLAASLPAEGVRADGLYVHVPFCRHKCHYCDFYSFVDAEDRQEAFVARLEDELAAWAGRQLGALDTLFIGGGTPTMLRAPLLERMLGAIRRSLRWRDAAEWTVEANPETVSEEIAAALASHGVTRVSMGAQSFQPQLLAALERRHDPASVARAVARLRSAGVAAINLDLIYAIPGSNLDLWRRDLDAALALRPQHLSCYGLMYESNTPLGVRHQRGEVPAVSEELELAMHELAADTLAAAGFEHYEISNWARPGRRCRHNEHYWNNRDWIAAGPAASGHADGLRWRNVPRLSEWLASRGHAPVQDVERLDLDGRVGEAFMMGLRLLDGMPMDRVAALLAQGDRAIARGLAIARFKAEGLLEHADARLRLTRRGRMLASEVAMALL